MVDGYDWPCEYEKDREACMTKKSETVKSGVEPRLYDEYEAAIYLGVGRTQIREWTSAGFIALTRLPHQSGIGFINRNVYDIKDLDNFIDIRCKRNSNPVLLERNSYTNDHHQKQSEILTEKKSVKPSKNVLSTPRLVYSVKEAAAALNISEATMRRIIYNRELPVSKVRGRIMVRITDVEKYLDRQKVRDY